MAVIKPFRGVRYNLERFQDFQALVSQPYDRIDRSLKDRYASLSPYNISRIILGHLEDDHFPDNPNGASPANVYRQAREDYAHWRQEGVFVREDEPVIYAYEQVFTVDGQTYTRLGMIAALQLAAFDEGVILPHERTHSGPKEDRLKLLKTLEVNTEQVFMLYPDSENAINDLLRSAIADREPDIDTVELFEHAVRQRVWIIDDAATIAAIAAKMAPKRELIIADGHHRYETGLTYRNLQREAHPTLPAEAAVNFIGATLVSMDDPGLVVLPTHREIRSFDAVTPAQILARAAAHFTVEPAADLDACLEAVNAHPAGHAFGFYGGAATGFHVLTLKDEDQLDTLIPEERSPAWKALAVSILHRVLLDQIAEVPRAGIEDKSMIRYHRSAQAAVANVNEGSGNFVFLLSPTRMAQIKACAAAGEKMPQKSTDFYPKVLSGITMLPVDLSECL